MCLFTNGASTYCTTFMEKCTAECKNIEKGMPKNAKMAFFKKEKL